jgi:hypothetical protein
MARIIAAAEHDLDARRVFARSFDAHAGERQIPLFELRADFPEDFQLGRTSLIALAKSLEILRPDFSFYFVLHVSSVLVDYALGAALTPRFRFNQRF